MIQKRVNEGRKPLWGLWDRATKWKTPQMPLVWIRLSHSILSLDKILLNVCVHICFLQPLDMQKFGNIPYSQRGTFYGPHTHSASLICLFWSQPRQMSFFMAARSSFAKKRAERHSHQLCICQWLLISSKNINKSSWWDRTSCTITLQTVLAGRCCKCCRWSISGVVH